MYYTQTHEVEENQLGIFSPKYILVYRVRNNLTGMNTYYEQMLRPVIYLISDIVFLFLNIYCTNFSQPVLIKYNTIAWVIIIKS